MTTVSLRRRPFALGASKLSTVKRLGDLARDRGDWSAAAEAYSQFIALRPDSFGIRVQLGHALKEAGRLDEALAAYKAALGQRPKDPDLLLQLGHIHKLTGDQETAIAFYRQSAEQDGNRDAIGELRRLGVALPPKEGDLIQSDRVWTRDEVVTLLSNDPLLKELFDPEHYIANYSDVRDAGIDPLAHFLEHGLIERRNPNPWFDREWYIATYPHAEQQGLPSLLHYLYAGWKLGYDPSPRFSTSFYGRRNPDSLKAATQPLHHFMTVGRHIGARTSPSRRILLVSAYCPTRAHAGGLRILDLYSMVRKRDPDAALDLATHKHPEIDWRYDDVEQLFDTVYDCPSHEIVVDDLVRLGAPIDRYDLVDFQFLPHPETVSAIRPLVGRILFTPMELLARAFALQTDGGEPDDVQGAEQARIVAQELEVARLVDQVVCVSKPDADFLREQSGLAHVRALETGVSQLEFMDRGAKLEARVRDRNRVLYVAYFGSQTNVDALDWYLRHVHPLIRRRCPDYGLDVVGRGDLSKFQALGDPSVNIVGEVPSIGPLIAAANIGIAPAISGAGFRGKVNQYATMGVPTVASPLAATGLNYVDGESILIGETPEAFAEAILALLADPAKRDRIGEAARQLCQSTYSWASREAEIHDVYGLPPPPSADHPPVHAIVPSYRHARYIRRRIESILGQTYPNIRLTVIDDCSPDESDAIIRDLQASHGFTYIRRKENSGTPFSAWAWAAEHCTDGYVWICESDDFAEPEFVERAVSALRSTQNAVIFYCNSAVIDADDNIKGSTAQYFREYWQDTRWTQDFAALGTQELAEFQGRGMIVPNMSSSLIDATAFAKAFDPDITRFKLTGDWLFVGRVLSQGNAVFTKDILNNFREHVDTARSSVKSARSQAEFVITKYRLHRLADKPLSDLAKSLEADLIRQIYEPASLWQIIREMSKISFLDTLKLAMVLPFSLNGDQALVAELRDRRRNRPR